MYLTRITWTGGETVTALYLNIIRKFFTTFHWLKNGGRHRLFSVFINVPRKLLDIFSSFWQLAADIFYGDEIFTWNELNFCVDLKSFLYFSAYVGPRRGKPLWPRTITDGHRLGRCRIQTRNCLSTAVWCGTSEPPFLPCLFSIFSTRVSTFYVELNSPRMGRKELKYKARSRHVCTLHTWLGMLMAVSSIFL
jgi:hypothetical protein